MRMPSSLLCISFLSVIILSIDPTHGLRVRRPPLPRIKRPPPSGHLNPMTRAVVDDAGVGFGHQFRRSYRDDENDDLQTDYFRFLLGDAAERKRRSPSSDHFVPDYEEFKMGGGRHELTDKRHEAWFEKPDYWDFVSGNTFKKKAESTEALRSTVRQETAAVDGEGMGFPVEEVQQIRNGLGHESR